MQLFFDLDGTLTDSAPGITRCIQHALETIGIAPPPVGSLRRFVGPPLRRTFAELLATDDETAIAAAIARYRERFADVGLFENEVYPAIPALLTDLRAAGHRLRVVTSKPHVYARRIVAHFGLDRWCEEVHGSELSGENADKKDLIAIALRGASAEPRETVMVGDRAADVAGGRARGVATVGVLWGYGTADELIAAGPDALVQSPAELLAFAAARAS